MPRIPIEACNDDGEQVRSFEVDGKEYPDSRPLELPVGASRPPTLTDQLKNWLRNELSEAARSAEIETFDEAGDFDIEDDPVDPKSPWEALFDPPPQGVDGKGETGTQKPGSPDATSQIASSGSGVVPSAASSPQTPIGGSSVVADTGRTDTTQTPSTASPSGKIG